MKNCDELVFFPPLAIESRPQSSCACGKPTSDQLAISLPRSQSRPAGDSEGGIITFVIEESPVDALASPSVTVHDVAALHRTGGGSSEDHDGRQRRGGS